jgi:hypothetical protein
MARPGGEHERAGRKDRKSPDPSSHVSENVTAGVP